MKKLLFLVCLLTLSLTACSIDDVCEKETEINFPSTESVLDNSNTTEELSVPVKSGYITNVYYDGELIAQSNQPNTIIDIPKSTNSSIKKIGTRAEETKIPALITFEYVKDEGNEVINQSKLYFTLLFEDSKSGENDYNDFVAQVCVHRNPQKISFDVQPVALGSTKNEIEFGVIISDGNGNIIENKEIYSDVRKDLFKKGPVEFVPSYKSTYISQGEDQKMVLAYITTTNDTIVPTSYVKREGTNIYDPVIAEGHGELIPNTYPDSDPKKEDHQYMDFKETPFINVIAFDKYKKGEETPYDTEYRVNGNKLNCDVNAYVFDKADKDANYKVNFYIAVDKNDQATTKTVLYAVSPDKKLINKIGEGNFLSDYYTPLGLVISDASGKMINYPRENVNINKVYPSFNDWIEGKIDKIDFTNPVSYTYFDAIGQKLYHWPNGTSKSK